LRQGRPKKGKRPAYPGLGDAYVDELFRLYGGLVDGNSDLVVYWIKKAADLLSSGQIRSFGLVATKSVAKGASRRPLEEICRNPSTVIFDAWTNEEWVIDGADVRVALICAGRASDGLTVTRSNRPPPT
jgi:hypothetical protein